MCNAPGRVTAAWAGVSAAAGGARTTCDECTRRIASKPQVPPCSPVISDGGMWAGGASKRGNQPAAV